MRIIVDSRERKPFEFTRFQDCTVERATLPAGDYSIPGFSDRVAVERKELDDLIGCLMGSNRERFERELAKLQRYEVAAVVCEGAWQDISTHNYRSKMRPQSVLQSIMAGSREAAEYITYGILSKFAEEVEKRFQVLNRSRVRPVANKF